MNIQFYPDDLDYVNAQLHPLSFTDSNSFLATFCNACLRADAENYELLRPVLAVLMGKYPARPERLDAERMDRV